MPDADVRRPDMSHVAGYRQLLRICGGPLDGLEADAGVRTLQVPLPSREPLPLGISEVAWFPYEQIRFKHGDGFVERLFVPRGVYRRLCFLSCCGGPDA